MRTEPAWIATALAVALAIIVFAPMPGLGRRLPLHQSILLRAADMVVPAVIILIVATL